MAARVDRTPPPRVDRENGELTELTRSMLMGDIRNLAYHQPLHPDGYRLEIRTHHNGDRELTVNGSDSNRLLYRLDVRDAGGTVELLVSDESDLTRQQPLNEKGATWFRELIADGLAQKAATERSVERMSSRELREAIIGRAEEFLGTKDYERVRAENGRHFLLVKDEGGVNIAVELPSPVEIPLFKTDSLVIRPDQAKGDLDVVHVEDYPPPGQTGTPQASERPEGASERKRIEASVEMGLADRELSRTELVSLYVDLESAELETPDEA